MFNRFFIFLGFALVGIVTVSWFEFDAAWWEPVSEATSVAERFELGYKSGGSERWRFPAFFEKNVEELGPMGMFLWANSGKRLGICISGRDSIPNPIDVGSKIEEGGSSNGRIMVSKTIG